MLDMAARLPIPASRFPPVPYLDPPPRRTSEAERRVIRRALADGAPDLPTDWPDLTPLIEAVDQALAGQGSKRDAGGNAA